MKATKVFLTIVGIVLLLVIGAGAYVYFNLNTLIKDGVETVGPDVTKTDVRLGSSNISILSGEGSLNNLFIGNPKGFKSESAFKLDSISMAVDLKSVTEEVVTIESIAVKGPKITMEVNESSSNIDQIMDNVQAYAYQSTHQKKEAAEEKEQEIKIIIKDVNITDGEIRIFAPGINQEVATPLPGIHLQNIGKDKNGVTVGEASLIIMEAIEKEVMASSANPLNELRSKFNIPLGGEKASFGDVVKERGVIEGVKGLFK
jgi:hypothetical protein